MGSGLVDFEDSITLWSFCLFPTYGEAGAKTKPSRWRQSENPSIEFGLDGFDFEKTAAVARTLGTNFRKYRESHG